MSRSRRFPMHVLTNQIDKGKAHRRVRKHVKQVLSTTDFTDVDDEVILDIEADTRSLGCEEWGTKFGYDFLGELGDEARAEFEDDKRKASRK